MRIQGVGPGGFGADGDVRPRLDHRRLRASTRTTPRAAAWLSALGGLQYSGNPEVPDAAVMTVLDDPTNTPRRRATRSPSTGSGSPAAPRRDFPTNVNEVTGGFKTPYGADGALVTQGGGIYVHSNVANMQVTDNVIVGNGGSYGGGVRVGTPYRTDNRNTGFTLARNQVRDNGGTNLAGGIGHLRRQHRLLGRPTTRSAATSPRSTAGR